MEALNTNGKHIYMLRKLLQDANCVVQNFNWFTFLLQVVSELRVVLTFKTLKTQESSIWYLLWFLK